MRTKKPKTMTCAKAFRPHAMNQVNSGRLLKARRMVEKNKMVPIYQTMRRLQNKMKIGSTA